MFILSTGVQGQKCSFSLRFNFFYFPWFVISGNFRKHFSAIRGFNLFIYWFYIIYKATVRIFQTVKLIWQILDFTTVPRILLSIITLISFNGESNIGDLLFDWTPNRYCFLSRFIRASCINWYNMIHGYWLVTTQREHRSVLLFSTYC